MDTQTLNSTKLSIMKILYLLLPFILCFYFLYPDAVFAQSENNIILPGGKKPNPKIIKNNSIEYISLKEFRSNFLPNYRFESAYVLNEGDNLFMASPSSFFLSSVVNNNQYVAQLIAPSYEQNGELFIPYQNIVEVLNTLNLYTSFELNNKTALRKVNSEETPKIEIPVFDIESSKGDYEIDYFREDNFSNEISQEIFTGGNFSELKTETNESLFQAPIAVSSIIRDAAGKTKNGFSALKPSNKVVFLEPSKSAPDFIKKKAIEPNPDTPPNLYIVPKGLFRKIINNNNINK